MRRIVNITLYLIFIAVISLPLLQYYFKFFEEEKLKGDYKEEKVVVGELTKESVLSGTFQSEVDRFWAEELGFKKTFIRINNQINYSLFNQTNAHNVIVGKNDMLLSEVDIEAFLGEDYMGKEAMENFLRRTKFVQEKLRERGIFFFIMLAPSKVSIYSENVPDKYFSLYQNKTSNYKELVKGADSLDIPMLDFKKYLLKNKEKLNYPLFPQNGIHWSGFTVASISDTLMRYIEKNTPTTMPRIVTEEGEITVENYRFTDYDIGEAMNLLWNISDEELHYPKLTFKSMPEKKPTMLGVGDSFIQSFFGFYPIFDSCFSKETTLWYYNKLLGWPNNYSIDPIRVYNLDMELELRGRDLIVLEMTEENIKKVGYGFIDDLHDYFTKPQKVPEHLKGLYNELMLDPEVDQEAEALYRRVGYTKEEMKNAIVKNRLKNQWLIGFDFEAEVEKVIKVIKNSTDWLKSIKEKAYQKNISVEESIRRDAEWVVRENLGIN